MIDAIFHPDELFTLKEAKLFLKLEYGIEVSDANINRDLPLQAASVMTPAGPKFRCRDLRKFGEEFAAFTMPEGFVTLPRLAKLTGFNPVTFYTWVESGILKAKKIKTKKGECLIVKERSARKLIDDKLHSRASGKVGRKLGIRPVRTKRLKSYRSVVPEWDDFN